jgi:hypothetical protein
VTDIKDALAQLRAARVEEDQKFVISEAAHLLPTSESLPIPQPNKEQTLDEVPIVRGEIKTLAGRVPLPLHRELTRGLLDAADELKVSKINIDEALEAAVRVVLRNEAATRLWYAQLREVRRERRET